MKHLKHLDKVATLWVTGRERTKLYVKPNGGGYDWIMFSPYTGQHVIKQQGGLEQEMTERVKAHWEGFQTNQTRVNIIN